MCVGFTRLGRVINIMLHPSSMRLMLEREMRGGSKQVKGKSGMWG